jgi:ribosomal protein S18 acetylase RimI-like enzyme
MRLSDLFESTTGNMEILKDVVDVIISKLPATFESGSVTHIDGESLPLNILEKKYKKNPKHLTFLNKIKDMTFVFTNAIPKNKKTLGFFMSALDLILIHLSIFMKSNTTMLLRDVLEMSNGNTFRGILLHELRHVFQSIDYPDYMYSDNRHALTLQQDGYSIDPIELDAAWFHHLQDYNIEEYVDTPHGYVRDVMQSFSGYKKLSKKQFEHYKRKTAVYYVAKMKGESVDHLTLTPKERLAVKKQKVQKNISNILNRFEWENDLNLREEIQGYDPNAGNFLLPMRRLVSVKQVPSAEKVSTSHKVFLFILVALGFSESTDNAEKINTLMKNVHKFTYQDAIDNIDETLTGYKYDNNSLKKIIKDVFSKELNENSELWNGKDVVAFRRGYRIVVDDPNDAEYVTVWTDANKKVGSLSTRGKLPHKELNDYLNIALADVDVKHRKQGLGLAMYKALINHMHPRWKGIASYLPDRSNKRQIPKIYQKLGGKIIDDDYMIVDRANLMENDREHQKTLDDTG